LLVEAQADWGGLAKGQLENDLWLDHGLKSLPVGPEVAKNPLIQLKQAFDLSFGIESWTDTPKTLHGNGNFVDFVGFGDGGDRSLIETLTYYTQSPRIMVSGGWKNLINELLALIPEKKRLSQAIVTKLEVKDDQVTAAVINGETPLKAEHFVFTLSPATLKEMLPQGAVSGKIIQRLARTTPLTAVSLDIITKEKISDAKNLFVLGEDPFYVIGQFISNVDPARSIPKNHLSTWMTFVDPEAIEDDESGSKILKSMKKGIKKAFPPLIEGSGGTKNWERLLVVPQAMARFDQLTLEENRTLPGLTNLWICGAQTPSADRNVGSALESATDVSARLIGEFQSSKKFNEETNEKAAPAEITP
jgi:hypothetical protein